MSFLERFAQYSKKNLNARIPPSNWLTVLGYEHDHRFNGFFCMASFA